MAESEYIFEIVRLMISIIKRISTLFNRRHMIWYTVKSAVFFLDIAKIDLAKTKQIERTLYELLLPSWNVLSTWEDFPDSCKNICIENVNRACGSTATEKMSYWIKLDEQMLTFVKINVCKHMKYLLLR